VKLRPKPTHKPPELPPERAMGDEELAAWLSKRPDAWGQNLSIVDGFVTAVVVGPISMHPLKWICPLLDIPVSAYETGGTLEFAALKAIMLRHNAISDRLVDGPGLKPLFTRGSNGQDNASDWCAGFMLCVDMNKRLWSDILKVNSPHRHLMMPVLVHRPVRVKGKDVTLDEPSILEEGRGRIPESVARLREINHLRRFGKPHPNAMDL